MYRPALLPLLVLLCAPVTALAQATGKEAMQVVARLRGADTMNRMLHVFGENGLPRPTVWRIVARDRANLVREYYVSKGAIVAEGVLPPERANGISPTPLPVSRLNVDSDGAFSKAELAARTAKIGFDRLHYQLRCLELSTNAAWFLSLVNEQGYLVGEVSVGASTGTVLTQKWYPVPVPPLAAAPPAGSPPADSPGFWDRARNGISRGANSVRKGVGNTAGWIQRKVSPSPQPPLPPR